MNTCKATNNSLICDTAFMVCNTVSTFYLATNRDVFDIREPVNDPFPPENYIAYLNTPEVLATIGAFQNYTECSAAPDFQGPNDFTSGTGLIQDLNDLITQDINIVLYHGDADWICNWMGGQVVANEIDAPGFSQAGFQNVSTPDNAVHGQVKQAATFSFVRVYEAGHEVPFYQPEFALTMFSRAISRKDLATGQVDANSSYKSVGTPESLFREGNATVQFRTPPSGAQYNTTTGEPSSPSSGVSGVTGTLWWMTVALTLFVFV
jgi:carboxypeptidase C (cathepsin A)